MGNSGRAFWSGKPGAAVRYWCPCPKGPLWITPWASGLQGCISRSPRECGGHVGWREARHAAQGRQLHLSNVDMETGVPILYHGEPAQHLPPQGIPETQGRIKVLLQIIIKKHQRQRCDGPWNDPLPNTGCDPKRRRTPDPRQRSLGPSIPAALRWVPPGLVSRSPV